MAFFCSVSGVRTIAPGVAKCAGGTVPEYDESDASIDAERAARATIEAMRKSPEEVEPSPEAVKAAENAALDQLTSPVTKSGKASNK